MPAEFGGRWFCPFPGSLGSDFRGPSTKVAFFLLVPIAGSLKRGVLGLAHPVCGASVPGESLSLSRKEQTPFVFVVLFFTFVGRRWTKLVPSIVCSNAVPAFRLGFKVIWIFKRIMTVHLRLQSSTVIHCCDSKWPSVRLQRMPELQTVTLSRFCEVTFNLF